VEFEHVGTFTQSPQNPEISQPWGIVREETKDATKRRNHAKIRHLFDARDSRLPVVYRIVAKHPLLNLFFTPHTFTRVYICFSS